MLVRSLLIMRSRRLKKPEIVIVTHLTMDRVARSIDPDDATDKED